MIGLQKDQVDIYQAAKAWDAKHEQEPFAIEVQTVLGWSHGKVSKCLHACVQKGYLAFDDDGRIIINEPPHERAMRLVCADMGISESDVTGPLQSLRLSGARRSIALRLKAVGYGYADIGRVVNRHQSTVMGYFELPRPQGGKRVRMEDVSCTA